MNLQGRVALVTGGAIRIGRAIVDELADAGARTVIHCFRDRERAEQARAELAARGREALVVQGDVSRSDEVARIFAEIEARWGGVDALVNNAGVFERTPFPDLTEDDWDHHLDINLKGAFLCCRAAARGMIDRRRGRIINIADHFGDHPWPAYLPYCVSKAGLITLTRALARALAPHNVQVNAIGPGAILFPDDYTDEQRRAALARVPAGKPGEPADIARTVRFLIEGPDYITGAIIPVDGGASLA